MAPMTVSTTTAIAAARRIQRRLPPRALDPDFAAIDSAFALGRPLGDALLDGLASRPAAWAVTALALRSLFESAARSLRAVANCRHRSKRSAGSLARAVHST